MLFRPMSLCRLRAKMAWGVVLLALVLRGLIPAGYMPQAATAKNPAAGLLSLALCHGSVATTATTDIDQWLAEAQDTVPESAPVTHAQAPCLFAVCLGHSALPTGPPVLLAAMQPQSHGVVVLPTAVTPQAHVPPLGARAPPFA